MVSNILRNIQKLRHTKALLTAAQMTNPTPALEVLDERWFVAAQKGDIATLKSMIAAQYQVYPRVVLE